MKSTDIIFKSNVKEKVMALCAIIFFLFLIFFLVSKNFIMTSFLAALAFIIYIMSEFIGKINTIKIDALNKRILFEIVQLGKKRIIEADIKDISMTYEQEVGARGVISYAFKVFKNEQFLIKIKPGISGWREEVLKDILLEIDQIKKEFKS